MIWDLVPLHNYTEIKIYSWYVLKIEEFVVSAIRLIHDKYKSEAIILTTTLCSLHAACTSEKAQ